MTGWTLAGCMALAALSAAAVLDVGFPAAEAATSVSPFAGSWSGTWSVAAVEHFGSFDWTISDEGRITGRVYGTTNGRSGAIVGHVGADGDITMIAFAPNDVPSTGFDGISWNGTALIDGNGTLVASMTRSLGAGGILLVATLERT
jgi:hypothetical protein